MAHPYKTREGGATVTVFVPYDCQNNCPFCINKKEYADCSGFSLEGKKQRDSDYAGRSNRQSLCLHDRIR